MKKLPVLTALLIPSMALAATIVKPYTFIAGQVVSSSQMNQVFDTLFTEINSKETRITTLETANTLNTAVTSLAANYTATSTDKFFFVDASGANVTVTLPLAPTSGKTYVFKRTDNSGNTLTIDGNGINIDGAATYTNLAAQYDKVSIVYDGTQWYIIAD